MTTKISLNAPSLSSSGLSGSIRLLTPLLDQLLGIHTLNRLYQQHQLQGLPPFEFISCVLNILKIKGISSPALTAGSMPRSGPVLLLCNHPYGGIEALILIQLLRSIRGDIKILGNAALQIFPELRPLLIPTNPLRIQQQNLTSIRQCESHLNEGGVLLMFPAGRVSAFQTGKDRICDGEWHRTAGYLAKVTETTLLPVYFHGVNSLFFQTLGRYWPSSRLLMLPREFLKLKGRQIRLSPGRPIPACDLRHLDASALTGVMRLMTYLQQDEPMPPPTASQNNPPQPVADYGDKASITLELSALPAQQCLLNFKQYSVYYAMAEQIPVLMGDIARERERVFRLYDEGSGEPRDTDAFDRIYVQLFVWDNDDRTLVGAYRMGRIDQLKSNPDTTGHYLARMFDFEDAFFNQAGTSLELGRSFIVPEHQKSFHALYLLWQGIGRFLALHPWYRRLYGTVSLSRLYDHRAVALLCDTLITSTELVSPKHPLPAAPHPEWLEYKTLHGTPDFKTLSAMFRALDGEGRDIPILVRHYHKLGAEFHCVGIDPNFNNTPGLLLSVDIARLTQKQLSTFLGVGANAYRNYSTPSTYHSISERTP